MWPYVRFSRRQFTTVAANPKHFSVKFLGNICTASRGLT
jgi:hypothetical protein